MFVCAQFGLQCGIGCSNTVIFKTNPVEVSVATGFFFLFCLIVLIRCAFRFLSGLSACTFTPGSYTLHPNELLV